MFAYRTSRQWTSAATKTRDHASSTSEVARALYQVAEPYFTQSEMPLAPFENTLERPSTQRIPASTHFFDTYAEYANTNDSRRDIPIQRKAESSGRSPSSDTRSASVDCGPARHTLDSSVLSSIEQTYGESFSDVLVSPSVPGAGSKPGSFGHAERERVTLDARLLADQRSPLTQRALAHELAHVAQCRRAYNSQQARNPFDYRTDQSVLETEAREASLASVRGNSYSITGASPGPGPHFGFWSDIVEGASSAADWVKEKVGGAVETVAEVASGAYEQLTGGNSGPSGEKPTAVTPAPKTGTAAREQTPAPPVADSSSFVARALALSGMFTGLSAPLAVAKGKLKQLPTFRMTPHSYQRISTSIAGYNGKAQEFVALGVGVLPPIPEIEGLAVEGGNFEAAIPAVLPALEAVAAAIAAAAAVLAELALDILIFIAIVALALLLLYLLYKALEAIVEAIIEAIEAMRNQPPILWSASLPPPPAMTFVRTKPPNPRVYGGQQDVEAARIRADGLSGIMIAHHVLPLFLGGRDELSAPPNVMRWPRAAHIIGHASLQVQPQMAIWGYPINIYAHPPPAGYFLAGIKVP